MATTTTDIAIIGAGPSGLFTIFQAGMLKMRCQVIDTLPAIGGQCQALYPEKPIYDIPAHPVITGEGLIQALEKQASPFNPVFHLDQQVTGLEADGDFFNLTTNKGLALQAKAVVIAGGCGAFGPNRPPLANIEAYENISVFYHVHKREQFRDKTLVIAGGGDSALDWTLSLAPIAQKIYLVHRRAKFRAAPESVAQVETLIASGKVELVAPFQLAAIQGTAPNLTGISVEDLDGNKRELKADFLLAFFGLSMQLGPILDWNLGIDYHRIAVNPATLEASTPGIYAIGDICTYPGKLKLILNGFAEAAMACHSIYGRVHPDQALHFEYSTTSGVPQI